MDKMPVEDAAGTIRMPRGTDAPASGVSAADMPTGVEPAVAPSTAAPSAGAPAASDGDTAGMAACRPDLTRAMGTRSIPVKATPLEPVSGRDDALERLERGLRRSHIALAVLGALSIALLAAVILLASGVLEGPVSAPVQGGMQMEGSGSDAGQNGADPSDEEPSTGDDGDATVPGDADGTEGETDGGADADGFVAADIVDIVGEKWSNALNILDALGVDEADLVVITDDGNRVFDPSNWTVTRVADLAGEGSVVVYLRHDTDPNPLNWLEDLVPETRGV